MSLSHSCFCAVYFYLFFYYIIFSFYGRYLTDFLLPVHASVVRGLCTEIEFKPELC